MIVCCQVLEYSSSCTRVIAGRRSAAGGPQSGGIPEIVTQGLEHKVTLYINT